MDNMYLYGGIIALCAALGWAVNRIFGISIKKPDDKSLMERGVDALETMAEEEKKQTKQQ